MEFAPFGRDLCEPYFATDRRPEITPGVCFRALLVGYFEGSDRSWDRLSLREFLSLPLTERALDHNSLNRIADRLPVEVYPPVFTSVLDLVDALGMLT